MVESRKERDLRREVFSYIQCPHIRSCSVHVIPDRCLPNLLLKNSSDGALTVSLGNLLQRFAVPIIKKGFLISNLQLKATISCAAHHQADLTTKPAPPSCLQFPHYIFLTSTAPWVTCCLPPSFVECPAQRPMGWRWAGFPLRVHAADGKAAACQERLLN